MKVNIRIKRLTLHGFDYHDHKRIGDAVRKELKLVIEKKGMDISKLKDLHNISSNIVLQDHRNSRLVGRQLASSIYRGLESKRK